MIHRSEMLALQSIEDFLSDEDISHLNKIMDEEAGSWLPEVQAAVLPAPAEALEILDRAVERALPAIQRAMPSIAGAASWAYTHLTHHQEVPTHLGGITDPTVTPRRIGRIGVVVTAADAGGQFYVETTSAEGPWTGRLLTEAEGYEPGTPLARTLPDTSTAHSTQPDWITPLARTRWICDAGQGNAVAYGTHLIHGVTRVRRGLLRKFVGDLIDAPLA